MYVIWLVGNGLFEMTQIISYIMRFAWYVRYCARQNPVNIYYLEKRHVPSILRSLQFIYERKIEFREEFARQRAHARIHRYDEKKYM